MQSTGDLEGTVPEGENFSIIFSQPIIQLHTKKPHPSSGEWGKS